MADAENGKLKAVEADSTSHSVLDVSEDSTSGIHKKPKTYENRKLSFVESNPQNDISITSSPCSDASTITVPSPQNTSRYGRTRKPKITEDFYNTEDIFGPYERIPCSPVRSVKKKITTKLELSPNNKSDEVVTLDAEILKPDINAMLSIDIPEETIEVSKVMKIVSNNTSDEFSPKSPSFAKPVKTYGKRVKKDSETIFGIESFGLPDYPAGENCPYVNGLSHSEESDSEAEIENKKRGPPANVSDGLVNSNSDHDKSKSSTDKRTKFNVLSLKKNSKSPVKNLIQSDNISTSTPESNKSTSSQQQQQQQETSVKYNKSNAKVSNSIENKFRVQKKPVPIGRLKAKKLKPLKKVSAPNINLGKNVDEQTSDSDNCVQSQNNIKNYEAIADLHKMYMPEVGDLTWSRVGSFPFWPSIVSKEPNTDRHTRTINFGKRITHFYHVNFFGDNGRRSWVLHTHIFPFHQRSDLEIMAKSVSKDAKPKEPRHLSAFIINPTKLVKWETAVTEAETLSAFPKENRIKKFFKMVNSAKKKSKNHNLDTFKSPSSEKFLKKIKKKLKKKVDYFEENDDLSIKIKEEIKEELLDEVNESFDKKSRKQRKRKPSIVSEDSFTDSEKFEPLVKSELRDTPSPVLSSSARHKKINLFKGISRDRVCQICGKNTNVYKCKGQCYGQYHIECDRKQKLRLPAVCDEKTDFEMLIGENIVGKKNIDMQQQVEIKIEEDTNTSNDVAINIIENILINVFEKVLPEVDVKKPIEESIQNLSIAEQIDLKMQEVMKNMVETNYNDSTTDYSSGSDNESKRNLLQMNEEMSGTFEETEVSSNRTTKVTKKVIKHVTADGVFDIIEEVEAEPEVETEDYTNFKCAYCSTGYKPACFICNKDKSKLGDVKKHKCMTTQCGKYYHAECLKDWPQTKWYLSTKRKEIDNENLSCPHHYCHTCISDDPRGPISRLAHEKLAKCIRCPTTYHNSSYCIPAGTEILSAYQIICPKHLISNYVEQQCDKKVSKVKLMHHVNASWCFICSMGGSLICCETCPSSFHVECLKMTPPEGKYICEECESGRLPLYDEIVWVKLGSYRWWPAQILFPIEIPDNVRNIAHNTGEFAVKFFGSHDYYWVNRGRVFLFQEGDTGHASSRNSAADRLFVKAIYEATKAHEKFVGERASRVADSKNTLKPPSYIKIKVNKPVGDVRTTDADTSNTTPCDCDPNWDKPCGLDSDCLNRILLTECNPDVCAAGNRCCNQSFQNRDYAHVEPFKTSARGWGLRALSPITQGTFVIEYVGEVINETEYMRRMKRKHEQKDENYYFLTIDKDRMIDAGPKGNGARFMNHSCSPNCETQKWTVNGDTRVGLFAIQDIPEGAELTFNYNLECIGEEKKECRCGAPNCSGFIGVKAKQDELQKNKNKKKKTYKKKPPPVQKAKTFQVIACFVCGKTNAIQQCDREACNKFYHLECVNLDSLQEGKWFCPWHSCNICTKRTTRCCYMCINSYCPLHSEGCIRYDRIKGFICKEHDTPELNAINSELSNQEETSKLKKKKYMKCKSTGETSKPKTIAEQDLEEILKYDVIAQSQSTNKKKKKYYYKKNKYFEGERKKKPKKVSERSLANLKQYRHMMHIKKVARINEIQTIKDKSTKTETQNKLVEDDESIETKLVNVINKNETTETKTEINDSENKSKSDKSNTKVEKTNGLHPGIKVETVKTNEPRNQNNNLSIRKRKSRLSAAKSDTSDDDDEDNIPLKRFKPDNSSCNNDNEIQSITKNMHIKIPKKLESSKSDNEDAEKAPKILRSKSVCFMSPKKETKTKHNVSSVNADKDSKQKKINKSADAKQINNSTESVVKRPRGRPRKYFPAPNDKEKESTTSKNKVSENIDLEEFKIKQEIIDDDIKNETNSSIESLSTSQNTELDSECSLDDETNSTKNYIQKDSFVIDLECDAEDEIGKSVINKNTLQVSSINFEKSNQQQTNKDKDNSARKKGDTKRNKLISPRPGIRKSLRITDPFDTSSNVSNSEFEISMELNHSQDLEQHIGLPKLNSTLLEEKQAPGRPKSSLKKKISNVPVRKSNRFSNTEDNKSIELKLPKTNETTQEIIDISNESDDASNTLDETSSPAAHPPVDETQKRKRGRPRKYFNLPPVIPAHLKRPIGRPKKIKLIEEPPKPNVEEATELYKMKLNTEAKPIIPYETHINEIKLTTNVPERHLRVMLRKSEIETKGENKFLKMQNDIERDLPIRKRSKLRYETHL